MKLKIRWPLRKLALVTFLIGLSSIATLAVIIRRQFFCPTSHLPVTLGQEQRSLNKNLVKGPSTNFQIKSFPLDQKLKKQTTQHSKPIKHVLTLGNSTFNCKRDGIITIKSGGRLGNQMGEYATLLALAKRDGLFPILQERTSTTLNKYFSHISVPSVKLLNCPMNWTTLNLKAYNLLEKSQRRKLAKNGVFIEGYPTSVSLFHRLQHYIKKEFKFKPTILQSAQKKLSELLNGRRNFILVGVHVRRTDYQQFLEGRFNAQLVGASYFSRAMEYFRKKFPSRVLFVVASDDLDWCRKNLQPVNDDIVYTGNGNPLNPAEDMALLASCNHSIITYGNFGFWSAYLAGGEVLLAGSLSPKPTELMHSIQSANIPGWKFLPGL